MRIHFHVIELDLPQVVGACTISGEPGFSTPLTCNDQSSFTTVIKTHKFTDTGLLLNESDVYKCLQRVNETTPKLKAGNGVASRATANISLIDFIEDPNLTSPALIANPDLARQGTFFGKLKARNILANKRVRVKYYESDGVTHTLIRTNNYIATDIKRGSNDTWSLTCKDVLYRADADKSQFPKVITGRLTGGINSGSTSITFEGDIADWTPFAKYTAVISNDLLMITNASGNATQVTLTVARASTITLGDRTILNQPEDHSAGDEVFRARKYNNANLYTVLQDVFADAGMSVDDYDGTTMQSEIATWIPSIENSIDAIFFESKDSAKQLDDICAQFMLDIWTDTELGKVTLKATTPWNQTTAVLIENQQIKFGSISISESKDLHYSRAFLQYDKRKLTESDDNVNFARSSLAVNRDLEGPLYYDEEKIKKLGKSIILSNKTSNIEIGDLITTRYVQRFSNRPEQIDFTIDESNLNFKLGDVVEIVTADNQDIFGNPKQGFRSQVTQVSPTNDGGRLYKVSTTTYNPFIGGVFGGDIRVNSQLDVNLYTESGGPPEAGTFTFIFDGKPYGQNSLPQAVAIGSFQTGSIVNIVAVNGAIITAKGGFGGNGGRGSNRGEDGDDGGDGGVTLRGTPGVTVNVYLLGATGDLGNASYTADGYLAAAGGGGSGGAGSRDDIGQGMEELIGGGGGGVGSGFTANNIGRGGRGSNSGEDGDDGRPGTPLIAGDGGYSGADNGAKGGNSESGASTTGARGGAAGKAIVLNSGTVNIITNGNTSRFKRGAGDAPSSIT